MILHLILSLLFIPVSNNLASAENYSKVTIEIKNKDNQYQEVYNSSNPDDIKLVESCLRGKNAPNFKCGYTGQIKFFKETGEVFSAKFNITSCNHIVYTKDGKLNSRLLSKKSLEFLNSLIAK